MALHKSIRSAICGLVVWAIAFLVSLKVGSIAHADWDLIVQLRLPRALMASAVGAGLALAGAALQALFSNPLCEPYTLGISSGAALGAVIGGSVGSQFFVAGLAGSAFLGALLFAGILLFVSRKAQGSLSLLLAGVMLGFLGSSLVALWMALADSNGIQGTLLWLFGDLSRARLQGALLALAALFIIGGRLYARATDLDGFLMGEEGARTLGVDASSARKSIIVWTSLLIGVCVSASGMIGFVGLVVPHFCRSYSGSLHRKLLPLCAIWGAAALTTSDALARALVIPYELPVGVVTALLGAPLFLVIMLRRREIS